MIAAMPRLEIEHRDGRRAVVELTGDAMVGKDPDNAICTAGDPFTSRRHARFVATERGWHVQDLGSENGTLVNEERIDRDAASAEPLAWRRTRTLVTGDVVRCGLTRLRFVES